MKYYIVDTIEQSEQCRKECLIAYMNNVPDGEYKDHSIEWSPNLQRLTDGKYIIPVCPNLGTFGYNIEESSDDWFDTEI